MILLIKTMAGSLIAFLACYPIARLAVPLTAVPKDFPPFTLLPILSGVVVGPIGAAIVFAIVKNLHPVESDRLFFFITLAFFALSLGLPLRLSFTQSLRFAGVTPAAQMILVLMHAIVAVSTFVAITYRTR